MIAVMWLQVAAAALIAIPLGLDLYMPVPDDNPFALERVERQAADGLA
jgi:hypothetical protein